MLCKLIGVPLQAGASQLGCDMGPSAYRAAGLATALERLGHEVRDLGNVAPRPLGNETHPNPVLKALPEVIAWTETLAEVAHRESDGAMPIFLGGDHALAAGTVSGMARRAAEAGRPLFVLWLDAHSDFHDLTTTTSGHLHGTPLAYVTGRPGFDVFPPLTHAVAPEHTCMLGLRSVDPAERAALATSPVIAHDMRAVDEHGLGALLGAFLDRVEAADGLLHVSLDVDFLDPAIAPAVGTTVPGGATFREAHLAMEMLHDSGLVTSLDLVELNPFLDERGRTARLMTDLTASLMGERTLDRPNIVPQRRN